ncbi:hypothetical protein [Lichenibacterium dinghuense]|uniref:hypothetical protein n=1 Tax=Lichenibacterium dinghuense TaxID=2895977 RepID=UPI001F267BF1|nr:hypothetical protein [Lichenibacterium sp. 6Y81]
MSAADLAAIAGTFLAAIISGLGLRRGEAEKKGLPAPDPGLSAGVFVGLEAETQRALLEELRDIHADLVGWRRQDETERRADKDRSVVERFELVESNQAKILGLLGKITDRGDQDHHRER